MQQSNIAWTDQTWNPTHGCSKVSAGCDNCYAERISWQYGHTDKPWTPENAAENVTLHPERLEQPYDIEPSRIFIDSMSDIFHSQVPESYIQRVFAVMRECPEHVFQVLTKRPGRAAHMAIDWPPNVWMGTSVEDHRVVERLDMLRDVDAALRFVSFEPLIGPVGDADLAGIDWAIVGGESGPDYRPMEHEWAREIFERCRDQDVAFFFKQSSGPKPETGTRLTVWNDDYGVFEQREIKEVPDVPAVTRRARRAAADGEYGVVG